MASMPEYDTLRQLVADAEDDVSKAVGGNKAAGTRARQKMQDVKDACQEVRKKILELRGNPDSGDGSDDAPAPADGAPAARI